MVKYFNHLIKPEYVSVIIILVFLFSCLDRGVINSIEKKKTLNIDLYIGNQGGTQILIYNTEQHAFVDSIDGFNECVWNMVATKSKNKLYVCSRESPNNEPCVYALERQSKEKKIILNKRAEIYISSKGLPFIVTDDYHDTLCNVGIIDTLSDIITWIDTLDILFDTHCDQSVVFDPQSSIFYGLTNGYKLFKYDYQTKQILRIYKNIHFPYHRMVINNSGKLIFFAGGPVFDVENDSIVGWVDGIYTGSLAFSPDMKYLYVTDPGKYLNLEPVPSGTVEVYYTPTRSTYTYIDVKNSTPDGHGWQTDRIVITNDGDMAFVTNWIDLIYILDLKKLIVSDIINLNRNAFQAVPLVIVSR